jgi:hypothetical protein
MLNTGLDITEPITLKSRTSSAKNKSFFCGVFAYPKRRDLKS